jgi:hypothetical protein
LAVLSRDREPRHPNCDGGIHKPRVQPSSPSVFSCHSASLPGSRIDRSKRRIWQHFSDQQFRTHRGTRKRFIFNSLQMSRWGGLSLTLPVRFLFSSSPAYEKSSRMMQFHVQLISSTYDPTNNAHYRWVAQLWSSERLFYGCHGRQIAANTGRVRRLPSDLCCGSSASRVAIRRIRLLTEPDITVITWVNWSAARRARLSAHCSTSPKRSAFDLLSCWSEWKSDWDFELCQSPPKSLPHQSSFHLGCSIILHVWQYVRINI